MITLPHSILIDLQSSLFDHGRKDDQMYHL